MRTLSAALWAAVLALASPAGASTFDQRFESQSAAASPRPALTFEQRYASQAQTVHWSNELLYRGVFSSWRALEPEGLHGPRPVARRAVMHPRVASLGPVRITHPNARAQGGMFSPQSIAKDMLQQKLSYRLGEMGVQYPGIPVCTAFSFGSLVVEGVKNHEHWTPLDTLRPVPPGEFSHLVNDDGRARMHGLMLQVSFDVGSQVPRGGVPARTVFLEGLHDDPVEVPFEYPRQRPGFGPPVPRDRFYLFVHRAHPQRRRERIFFTDDSLHLDISG